MAQCEGPPDEMMAMATSRRNRSGSAAGRGADPGNRGGFPDRRGTGLLRPAA
jgi:hypothetical protein